MNSPHPIDQCSLAEAERIWREIAASRGLTLEEFDWRVGVVTPVMDDGRVETEQENVRRVD